MRQRQPAEPQVAVGHFKRRDRAQRVGHQVAVAEHHALGLAGVLKVYKIVASVPAWVSVRASASSTA